MLCALAVSWISPLWAAAPLALFLLLCAVAPAFPRWSFFLPVLSSGPAGRNAVSLTFDDGPHPESTPALLAVLARHGAKAAFFVVGQRADAWPELVRQMVDQGHEIGNHSWRHDLFLMLRSCRTLESEVVRCQEALDRLGVRPLCFRPPVGITNSRLRGVLERLGLFCVCFKCRPLDFGNRRLRGLASRVLRTVEDGDVVLLHDCPPKAGVAPWLAEVEAVLDGLAAKGLKATSLSELLDRPVMEVEPGPGERV